jgi:hypothetical protein
MDLNGCVVLFPLLTSAFYSHYSQPLITPLPSKRQQNDPEQPEGDEDERENVPPDQRQKKSRDIFGQMSDAAEQAARVLKGHMHQAHTGGADRHDRQFIESAQAHS